MYEQDKEIAQNWFERYQKFGFGKIWKTTILKYGSY